MKVGVLTSGGDAPGMNAVIRAVVRTAKRRRREIFGVTHGFRGLCAEETQEYFKPLSSTDVAHILARGGTILKSDRYPEFEEESSREKALKNLRANEITSLVVIGGDGSFRGARALYETNKALSILHQLRVVCIPATIDNDIPYTKYSVGADTALNTVVNCIDKIRDTAYSHKRTFVIQVMGRDCDYLPTMTGISTGAHVVLGPHDTANVDLLVQRIEDGFRARKDFVIIVVAEGLRSIEVASSPEKLVVPSDEYGRFTAADIIMREISNKLSEPYKGCVRPVVLGHVQRGGSPSNSDRILATRFGVAAIRELELWSSNPDRPYMLALQNKDHMDDRIVPVPLDKVLDELDRSAPKVDKRYKFISQYVIRGFAPDETEWPLEL